MLAIKSLGVFTILTLGGLAACGSDGPPATATPGSKFCLLAADARAAGQAMDTSASPEDLKKQIAEASRTADLAMAQSPKDFQDIAKRTDASQDAFVALLEENDYDLVALISSDAGAKLLKDPEFTGVQQDREDYLADKCDLAPTESTEGAGLNLGDGDEGIRNLFKLLQVAPGSTVTDEQIDCAVDNLSGNLSGEEINSIATQTGVTDDTNIKLGLAVEACGIDLSGS